LVMELIDPAAHDSNHSGSAERFRNGRRGVLRASVARSAKIQQ